MSRNPQPRPPAEGARTIDARLIVAVVVVALLIAFIVQNRARTDIHWLFFTFAAPLWVVLAVSIGVAVLVGYVLGRRGATGRAARR